MTLNIAPTAQAFLGFLEKEISSDPKRLKPFGGETTCLAERLVDGVEIDLNAPLDDD
ncbi:putative regulator PrlF [Pseudooceanicola marinus]|uniref:Putative regulator PrlF n=1 Tax=Pseudooceanicola marinus TaxID=396013 RepID=A0A1X7A6Y7_9RHOB|nr:type II toxin-antitoxin system PrlF family antitoxin [Pseudooceanicola marinus]SLN71900.1 putative regulator PrlF [Pseudooceanicola marinus]